MTARCGPGLRTLLGAIALACATSASGHLVTTYEGVSSFETTVQYNLRSRPVLVLHPTVTQPNAPVLILLTYLNGLPANMADFVTAQLLVRDYGAWVLIPRPANGKWNDGSLSGVKVVDDVDYLAQLIDYAAAHYPIDPHRVYMAGFSNGALMTGYFSCSYPNKVAAIGMVAGTFRRLVEAGCSPPASVPVALIEGTDDSNVPYDGNSYFESVPGAVDFWRQVDGCSATPVTTMLPDRIDDGTTVRLDSYQDCSSGDPVALYSVIGGGHAWPGTLDFSPVLGKTSQDINATVTLWQFFQRFSRP